MKKTILKLGVFAVIFFAALIIVGKIMNKGHDNLTMEMARASLPIVSMKLDGRSYNELHGYTASPDVAFQRDTVTVLGENRETGFTVDTYGREVTGIYAEVRSADGARLIERTALEDYKVSGTRIEGELALKDLLEAGEEYSLAIQLELEGTQQVSYYTRIVWSSSLSVKEKLDYVLDFHERLYDREAARELTKYLETDAKLEDNSSFHNVNIHSSFRQLTWGDLNVTEVSEPVLSLTDVARQTASVLLDYIVSTEDGKTITYYMVREHYRIRYTQERTYLLDYQRTMTQIPDTDVMYGNDKLLLGITDVEVPMLESEDGNIVVFQEANRLFSYNITTNQLAVLFSFYDKENADARTLYGAHTIKVLDVDEGGNVQFAVYGYMNRGRHEGEVGLQLYTYNSSLNTTEELIYIPYSRTYAVLKAEMEQLLYLNREQKLYLTLEDAVYKIDLTEKKCQQLLLIRSDGMLQVSDNHKIAVWPEGEDISHSTSMIIRNLSSDTRNVIAVEEGEAIRPLGFMGEDIIYGVAYTADVTEDSSGRIFFPMYKIVICNASGGTLKEYSQPGVYVTECTVADNQITLERLERTESGDYREILADHIMNSVEAAAGKNVIVAADIDRYERYVQIRVRKTIDTKTIKILTPKEIVYEGGRTLELPGQEAVRYYVYGAYGVEGIFHSPAEAVQLAYSVSGVVAAENGECIWRRGNRLTRNQIMAIKEPEQTAPEESLGACLDAIFRLEGIVRNPEQLLEQESSVPRILGENLEEARALDLTGCNLDSVLYYVNRDIPVLALLKSGEAVLITGFNETQVVIFEPSSGKLYKKSMSDSAKWFEENGNRFITYY